MAVDYLGRKILNDDEGKAVKALEGQAKQYENDWTKAKANGDTAGMQAAHEGKVKVMGDMDFLKGTKSTYDPNKGTWSTENAYKEPVNSGYTPINQGAIDDLMADIQGSKFSYNPENDSSFQAYRDMYTREGERAAKSTLADVAQAQGGVSSYAASAAQQANNYYAQQISDKIPYLEQLAYEKYGADLNNKYQMLDFLKGQDDSNYNRYIQGKTIEMQDKWNADNIASTERIAKLGDETTRIGQVINAYLEQMGIGADVFTKLASMDSSERIAYLQNDTDKLGIILDYVLGSQSNTNDATKIKNDFILGSQSNAIDTNDSYVNAVLHGVMPTEHIQAESGKSYEDTGSAIDRAMKPTLWGLAIDQQNANTNEYATNNDIAMGWEKLNSDDRDAIMQADSQYWDIISNGGTPNEFILNLLGKSYKDVANDRESFKKNYAWSQQDFSKPSSGKSSGGGGSVSKNKTKAKAEEKPKTVVKRNPQADVTVMTAEEMVKERYKQIENANRAGTMSDEEAAMRIAAIQLNGV